MYRFIKIRQDIIKQCHKKYKEMKKFNYKLEIEIFRNSTLKDLGVLRGSFQGFWCPKRHPDALLAKTVCPNLPIRANPSQIYTCSKALFFQRFPCRSNVQIFYMLVLVCELAGESNYLAISLRLFHMAEGKGGGGGGGGGTIMNYNVVNYTLPTARIHQGS